MLTAFVRKSRLCVKPSNQAKEVGFCGTMPLSIPPLGLGILFISIILHLVCGGLASAPGPRGDYTNYVLFISSALFAVFDRIYSCLHGRKSLVTITG